MIRIVLAGEPRGKGRPRFLRNPIKRTTKDGREWEQRAIPDKATLSYEDRLRWAAQIEMRGAAPLVGPLGVSITSRMSVPKSFSRKHREAALAGALRPLVKPDFDNFAKVVDSLNKIVWVDDAHVVDAHIYKYYSEKPQMEICVWPLSEDLTAAL